jgi:outer membrane immunogenic protein
MRKLLSLAAGMSLAFLSTGAFADGYSSGPVQTYQPFSWTGIYIGGQIGDGWGDADLKFAPPTVHEHFNGFAYGGQIGAQYQFSQVVVGIEVSYTNDHDGHGSSLCPNPAFQCRARIDDATQVVGRLGYAWGNFLPYFKGGYASVYTHFSNTPPTASAFNSATHRHEGWVLGGGLDYAIYKNIIVGVDYSHIEFDKQTYFAGGATFGVDGSADIVMARLSYKFSWDREVAPLK